MQNKHGGLWNPDWIVEETGAYPVEDYVYMVTAPLHKPKFFQDSWDAFHDPMYQKVLNAKIVQIPVQPVSKQERHSRQTFFLLNGEAKNSIQPNMIAANDYFTLKRIKLTTSLELNGLALLFLLIGIFGTIIFKNQWFLMADDISLILSIAAMVKAFRN